MPVATERGVIRVERGVRLHGRCVTIRGRARWSTPTSWSHGHTTTASGWQALRACRRSKERALGGVKLMANVKDIERLHREPAPAPEQIKCPTILGNLEIDVSAPSLLELFTAHLGSATARTIRFPAWGAGGSTGRRACYGTHGARERSNESGRRIRRPWRRARLIARWISRQPHGWTVVPLAIRIWSVVAPDRERPTR